MPDVFINYRTGDEAAAAKLIDLDLSRRFGSNRIFFASKSIKPGENFPDALRRAVRSSRVLLAVIGRAWLTARDAEGRSALDNEGDWIRRELVEAFECGVCVIPVLVDGAPRLSPAALPPALHALAECEYRRFSHRTAEDNLDRLSRDIIDLVFGLVDSTAAQQPTPEAQELHSTRNTATDVRGFSVQARDVGGTIINTANGPIHSGTGAQYNVPRVPGDGPKTTGDHRQDDEDDGGASG